MPNKKENNKKSFDLADRWRKRKQERNAKKKQVWADNHWEVKSE